MQALKFRAWDEDGYMFEVSGLEFIDGDVIVHEAGTQNFGSLGSGVVALMQYTGLKDKNGKEIYEGDLVSFMGDGSDPREVYYKDGAFWPVVGFGTETAIIVLGNIYENPDLLQKST